MANINYTGDVYTGDLYSVNVNAGGASTGGTEPPREETGGPVGAPPGRSSFSSAVNILGAMASLALVAGVGVWGYKLLVRDVSGVPVVRALQGPMRVQPDNPGGQQADHQGLAVNAVAAQGTAAAPADRVMLAPRPVELALEDKPMGQVVPQLAALRSGAQTGAPETLAGTSGVAQDQVAAADGVGAASDGSVEALVEQLTAGVPRLTDEVANAGQPEELTPGTGADTPQADPETAPETVAETAAEQTAQVAVLQGPGLQRSLRPRSRPARAVVSRAVASGEDASTNPILASAISSAVETVASLDVDPDSLPTGTRLAQLGAYDTAEIARAEWDRLNARFEDYMDGKKRVVQMASSGGRTFYRLRAMGFDDMNDARRFCSALMAENADCIPVTTR